MKTFLEFISEKKSSNVSTSSNNTSTWSNPTNVDPYYYNKINQYKSQEYEKMGLNIPVKRKWSARKAQVLSMWRHLRSDVPIYMKPMSKQGRGSSYGEDGIRITGSFPFIVSVLGRIKDILSYENQDTKLRIIFRSIDHKRADPTKPSYVFYVNVERRGKGKPGKKKLIP